MDFKYINEFDQEELFEFNHQSDHVIFQYSADIYKQDKDNDNLHHLVKNSVQKPSKKIQIQNFQKKKDYKLNNFPVRIHKIPNIIPNNQLQGLGVTELNPYQNIYQVQSQYSFNIKIINANNGKYTNYEFSAKMLSHSNIENETSIYIGRNIQNQIGVNTPLEDREISRQHLKIDTKEGFLETQSSRLAIYELLKLFYVKFTDNLSIASEIPLEIYKKIFCYIREPINFILYDLGSLTGSYVKMKKKEKYLLYETQELMIGLDIHLYVRTISNSVFLSKKLQSEDFLFKYLLKEKRQNNALIVGLSDSQIEILIHNERNSQNIIQDREYQEIDLSLKYDFSMSYIKFEVLRRDISKNPNCIEIPKIMIILGQSNEFKIGRDVQNQISFGEQFQNISREHALLFLENDNKGNINWYIMDGNKSQESKNGTWLSLTNRYQRKNKINSIGYCLKNEEVITIGKTLIEFNITYKKVLTIYEKMELE